MASKNRIRAIIEGKDNLSPKLQKVAGNVQRVGAVAGVTAAAMAAAGALIASEFVRQLSNAAAVSGQFEAAQSKLQVALAAQGQLIPGAAEKWGDLAAELVKVSNATETQILSAIGQAKALGASDEAAEKIIRSAIDMAAIVGDTDLAFRQVVRTLGGYKGELQETGVDLEGLTREQLKAGAAADRIQAQFGGAGQVVATTYLGSINNVKSAWEQFAREVGGPVRDAIADFNNNVLIPFIENLRDDRDAIDSWRDGFVDVALASISAAQGIQTALSAWVAVATVTGATAGRTFDKIKSVLGSLTGVIGGAANEMGAFARAMDEAANAQDPAERLRELADRAENAGGSLNMMRAALLRMKADGLSSGARDRDDILQRIQDGAVAAGKATAEARVEMERYFDTLAASGEALSEFRGAGITPISEEALEALDDAVLSMVDYNEATRQAYASSVILSEHLEEMATNWQVSLETIAKGLAQTAQDINTLIVNVVDQTAAGISSAIGDALLRGKEFGDAMKDILRAIGQTIIDFLVQAAKQAIAAALLGTAAGTKQHIARMGQLAAQTYGGAFAATAAIPIVGPFLAPGVAQAALTAMIAGSVAASAAGSAAAVFQQGGVVPGIDQNRDSVPALLQPGEMVLRRDVSDKILNALDRGGSGGPVQIELTVPDGDSVAASFAQWMNFHIRQGSARLFASELVATGATR